MPRPRLILIIDQHVSTAGEAVLGKRPMKQMRSILSSVVGRAPVSVQHAIGLPHVGHVPALHQSEQALEPERQHTGLVGRLLRSVLATIAHQDLSSILSALGNRLVPLMRSACENNTTRKYIKREQ